MFFFTLVVVKSRLHFGISTTKHQIINKMKTYAYLRVSTTKQNAENQRFALKNYAKKSKIKINEWVSEIVSGIKNAETRKLGGLFEKIKKGDTILVSEISRLGRNTLMVMDVLRFCIERGCKIITAKEDCHFDNSINCLVMTFAFALVAQKERELISQRTKEALARVRAEGRHLGRKHGFTPAILRLRNRREDVWADIASGATRCTVAAKYGVSVGTLRKYLNEIANDVGI